MRNRGVFALSSSHCRTFINASLVASAISIPWPATAQADLKISALVTLELKRQFGTAEQLDDAINKTYGERLPPDKAKVARDAFRSVLFNSATPSHITKLVAPLYRPNITREEVANAMLEGIAQMQIKGLSRLAPDRQSAFVAHMVTMMRAIDPSDCKALYLGRMDTRASAVLERRYIAQLPLQKFVSVTNLYKEASEAELVGFPDARTINAQQAKLAETAYDTASIARMRAQVPRAALQRVGQSPDSAEPEEVCAVLAATLGGMLDLTEPYRSWQLTRFMASIQ